LAQKLFQFIATCASCKKDQITLPAQGTHVLHRANLSYAVGIVYFLNDCIAWFYEGYHNWSKNWY